MAAKPNKPKKPYKDFPLFAHAVGQWAKKIRGKTHYFGAWGDPDAALQKYTAQRDDLHAGRTPGRHLEGLTVRDLVNQFLTAKKALLPTGELSHLTWKAYYTACERIVANLGAGAVVAELAPGDFARFRATMAETLAPFRSASRFRESEPSLSSLSPMN